MSQAPPPVVDDVVIHGDALRRRGLWLPVQPVADNGASRAPTRDLPPGTRAMAERILPEVRQRALEAGRRAVRPRPRQDDDR
ncbi:MAG: hypothetical protein R6V11_07235 [Ectothiorhodospiraceae bacterium]